MRSSRLFQAGNFVVEARVPGRGSLTSFGGHIGIETTPDIDRRRRQRDKRFGVTGPCRNSRESRGQSGLALGDRGFRFHTAHRRIAVGADFLKQCLAAFRAPERREFGQTAFRVGEIVGACRDPGRRGCTAAREIRVLLDALPRAGEQRRCRQSLGGAFRRKDEPSWRSRSSQAGKARSRVRSVAQEDRRAPCVPRLPRRPDV